MQSRSKEADEFVDFLCSRAVPLIKIYDPRNIAKDNIDGCNHLFRVHWHPDPYVPAREYERRLSPPNHTVFATPHQCIVKDYLRYGQTLIEPGQIFTGLDGHRNFPFLTVFRAKRFQKYYEEYSSYHQSGNDLHGWERPDTFAHYETYIDVLENPIRQRFLVMPEGFFGATSVVAITPCIDARLNEFRRFDKTELLNVSVKTARAVINAYRSVNPMP